jgi:type II secretory pathway pseudopilin PulG
MTEVSRGIARIVAVALGVLVLAAAPAHAAQEGGRFVQAAADAFKSRNAVYVDPGAAGAVSQDTIDKVRDEVRTASRPIYVAVLPGEARNSVTNPRDLPKALHAANDNADGAYVVLTVNPNGIFVDASGGPGASDTARKIAEAAQDAGKEGGSDAALLSAVEGAAKGEPVNTESGLSTVGVVILVCVLLLVVGVILGLVMWGVRRSRRRREQELAEVKRVAEEDVTRLGEDIAALDLDVDAPNVDEPTRASYRQALESYDLAKAALVRARRTEELSAVTTALEDGRYAMSSVRARLAGEPVPERRPPCFFNPQHGPSVEDAPWAPPGGAERYVPACAADAERLRAGMLPESRQVYAGGRWRPYWDAGPAYGPWARGYYSGYGAGYGGDMLSGLLVGTLLGSALGGGWGGGWGGGGWSDGGGGGGGGGDFGGGGGDFGGGGGDFGGGGGDF